jgi:hypothetical protein
MDSTGVVTGEILEHIRRNATQPAIVALEHQ